MIAPVLRMTASTVIAGNGRRTATFGPLVPGDVVDNLRIRFQGTGSGTKGATMNVRVGVGAVPIADQVGNDAIFDALHTKLIETTAVPLTLYTDSVGDYSQNLLTDDLPLFHRAHPTAAYIYVSYDFPAQVGNLALYLRVTRPDPDTLAGLDG